MCGRYALALAPAALAQRLIADGLPVDEAPPAHEVCSGHNVAPGSHQPVYRALPPAGGRGEERFGLTAMRWGLVPPGSCPTTTTPTTPTPINCRDTALRRPTGLWHTLRHTNRCLVPAQGFYEWHPATRTPHYVQRRDRRLLLLAALWACHPSPSASSPPQYSFAIVTTAAAPAMRFLHARMPVVVDAMRFLHARMPVVVDARSEGARLWLARDVRWGERMQALCVPWQGEGGGLEVYPVPAEVGDVRRDESWFVRPVAERRRGGGGGVGAFFGRGVQEEEEDRPTPKSGTQDVTRDDAQQADKHPAPETNPKEEDGQEEWQAWPEAYRTADTPEEGEEGWETWPEATTTNPPEPAPTATTTTTATTATLKRARGTNDASPPPPPAKAVRSATGSAVGRRGGRAGRGRGRGRGGDGTPLITRFFKR